MAVAPFVFVDFSSKAKQASGPGAQAHSFGNPADADISDSVMHETFEEISAALASYAADKQRRDDRDRIPPAAIGGAGTRGGGAAAARGSGVSAAAPSALLESSAAQLTTATVPPQGPARALALQAPRPPQPSLSPERVPARSPRDAHPAVSPRPSAFRPIANSAPDSAGEDLAYPGDPADADRVRVSESWAGAPAPSQRTPPRQPELQLADYLRDSVDGRSSTCPD